MRKFTPFASQDTQHLLDVLVDQQSSPTKYRDAMTSLGRRLAERVADQIPSVKQGAVCIVCTVEDADFLARGLLEGLEERGVDSSHLKLVCFWNERVRTFTDSQDKAFDVAPIIKSYKEEVDIGNTVLVMVKSIISGACVVKTNLAALIDKTVPQRVIVAAPVMLAGAEKRLAAEFPEATAKRFEYFTFAIDDKKDADENVVPGIGGSVYTRLGFENKNAYVPDIVRQRRHKAAHA